MKTPLLFLLLPVAALAAQESPTIDATMKDGRTERIQPLELNGDKARFRVFVLGGEMVVTRKLSDFSPDSAFRFEVATRKPDSFEDHFDMAKKAADLDLLPPAGAQARQAIEKVKGTPEEAANTAKVRAWAADTLETKLRAAIAAADLAKAKQLLKLLTTRLSDQRTEESLAALAESVDGLSQKAAEGERVSRQEKLDAKARDAIEKRLKPIYERIEKGDKYQTAGISQSRKTVQATRQCEQSIDAYKAAWKATQELAEKYPDDEELAKEVAAIGSRLQTSAIRSALHAANMLVVQSDYKGAMDWTGRVLRFDPDNAEAQAMVRTIQVAEAAASSQWGWGWTLGGGAPPVPTKY
ncbi:MAG TPA: hypothetical protein VFZ65_12125 [Planctomycetota bacterium]|nr:hypothetical protein [Planctomycetota bacterium]